MYVGVFCGVLTCQCRQSLPSDQSLARRPLRAPHALVSLPRKGHFPFHIAANQNTHKRLCTLAAAQGAQLATPLEQLQDWLVDNGGSADALDLTYKRCIAARKLRQAEVIMSIPGDAAVTQADVRACSACSQLAEGRGELIGLALWLASQRTQGAQSQWHLLVSSLPQQVDTPVLWPPDQRAELLQGSAALQEAETRYQALQAEWDSIAQQTGPEASQAGITKDAFMKAASVVIAHAAYLPSAQCFALLPVASTLARTGADTAASLDYDLEQGCVKLTAQRTIRQGEEIAIYDGRPTTEMLLATGMVEESNPSDYLTVTASLVAADRLYMQKKQIVQSLGFEAVSQEFPIYADRMPTQLLAYLRLSRLQDSGDIIKVNFEEDRVISPANEYEVLQLLMADMRDRLTAYSGSIEDEVKLLQRKTLASRQRVAAQTRLSEKIVLQKTLDAVRRRLAPIRGIPTKSGKMKNPNADLEDIFSTIENIPNAPKKLFAGIKSWARGDQDPTWKR